MTIVERASIGTAFGAGPTRRGNGHRRFVAAGAEQMSFIEAGSGPALVLIHGTLTTAEDMAIALMDLLSPDFRVIAIDRPGHGESTRPRFGGAPSRQAAIIRAGLDALGVDRPLLVGHSLGGTVALELARQGPDRLSGVIALAPLVVAEPRIEPFLFGARALPGLGDFAALFNGLGPDVALMPLLWSAMFKPQRVPERFRAEFPFARVMRGAQLMSLGEDSLAVPTELTLDGSRYGGLEVPLAIMAGESDIVVDPNRHSAVLARLNPSATFTRLPQMGHMIHHFAGAEIARAGRELAQRGA